jgi:alpha-tubulin suppressor-like RCC1 family protein
MIRAALVLSLFVLVGLGGPTPTPVDTAAAVWRRCPPLTRSLRDHEFVALSAGSHTCALDRGGEAYCWGANIQGQLGDGTTEWRLTPTPVAGEHNFTAISTGSQHTCALELDGRALCWGANRSGQLGDGTTTDRLIPTPVVDPEGAGEG